jgi:hypothetical protein
MDEVSYSLIPGFAGYRAGTDGSLWTCWRFRGTGYSGLPQHYISDPPQWRQLRPDTMKRDGRKIYKLRVAEKQYVRQSGGHFVLLSFVGLPPDGMECCHNDNDAGNDALNNVRWDTHLANMRDQIAHGTRPRGEGSASSKLNDAKIVQIRQRYATEKISKEELGRQYGVTGRLIGCIVRREIWKHVP